MSAAELVELSDLLLSLVLGIVLTATLLRRDMRRAPRDRLARGWNEASFWSAVVAFGPLCIPVHFARTRRTVPGFVLGLLWAAGILLVTSLVGEAVGLLARAGG